MVIEKLIRLIRINRIKWNIGFILGGVKNVFDNNYKIQWVKGMPKDRWFADPFILRYDEREIVVLAEEMSYKINKGRIAVLFIDAKTFCLKSYKIILEIGTHLSFPAYVCDGNDVYVYPESWHSGKSMMYKMDTASYELKPFKELSDQILTDAVLYSHEDKTYLISMTRADMYGKELNIYAVDKASPDRLYFTMNDLVRNYKFDEEIGRGAGNVFEYKGNIYRPAQDCKGGYGKGVLLQKIYFEDGQIHLDVTNSVGFYPEAGSPYGLGYHTFNVKDDLIVVDGYNYVHPRLMQSFKKLVGRK